MSQVIKKPILRMTRVVFGSRCVENILSNFCPTPLEFEGLTFTCTESLFQGIKALYSEEPEKIKDIAKMDCYDARKAGRALKGLNISKWNSVNVNVMRMVLRERWKQHPEFKRRVIAYGQSGCTLVHFDRNPKKSFWGGEKNMLGQLIMEFY